VYRPGLRSFTFSPPMMTGTIPSQSSRATAPRSTYRSMPHSSTRAGEPLSTITGGSLRTVSIAGSEVDVPHPGSETMQAYWPPSARLETVSEYTDAFAPGIASPSLSHWYSRPTPMCPCAATEKTAVSPMHSVSDWGSEVITGASGCTTSVAGSLTTVPQALDTTTSYTPAWANDAAAIASEAPVAPGISSPLNRHWYERGAEPQATTWKSTGSPTHTSVPAGDEAIAAGSHDVPTSTRYHSAWYGSVWMAGKLDEPAASVTVNDTV